jgi:hypothetical protein
MIDMIEIRENRGIQCDRAQIMAPTGSRLKYIYFLIPVELYSNMKNIAVTKFPNT